MRTIIAGSRTFYDYDFVKATLGDACITTVISGGARGADELGERWAREKNVPIERFPAEWTKYGKSAGYRRNQQMAEVADMLVAFWDGESRGTKHMIDIAKARGLHIIVARFA